MIGLLSESGGRERGHLRREQVFEEDVVQQQIPKHRDFGIGDVFILKRDDEVLNHFAMRDELVDGGDMKQVGDDIRVHRLGMDVVLLTKVAVEKLLKKRRGDGMTWIEGDAFEGDASGGLPNVGKRYEGVDVWAEERHGRDIAVFVPVGGDDEIDRVGRENIL